MHSIEQTFGGLSFVQKPGGACMERSFRVHVFIMRSHDEHFDFAIALFAPGTDLLAEFQSMPILERDIDNRQIGPRLENESHCLGGVRRFTTDLEIRIRPQELCVTMTNNVVIVDDEYSNTSATCFGATG
jgi:hypothetical protein